MVLGGPFRQRLVHMPAIDDAEQRPRIVRHRQRQDLGFFQARIDRGQIRFGVDGGRGRHQVPDGHRWRGSNEVPRPHHADQSTFGIHHVGEPDQVGRKLSMARGQILQHLACRRRGREDKEVPHHETARGLGGIGHQLARIGSRLRRQRTEYAEPVLVLYFREHVGPFMTRQCRHDGRRIPHRQRLDEIRGDFVGHILDELRRDLRRQRRQDGLTLILVKTEHRAHDIGARQRGEIRIDRHGIVGDQRPEPSEGLNLYGIQGIFLLSSGRTDYPAWCRSKERLRCCQETLPTSGLAGQPPWRRPPARHRGGSRRRCRWRRRQRCR